MCGASEICLSANRDLCKRLNLPFFISDYTWDIVNDKQKFKEECRKVGVPVANDFKLTIELLEEDLESVVFPVVVKPADGASSIGFHICNNREELIEGYKDAYKKSKINKVVVEEYVFGEQTGFIYSIHNGIPVLITSGDDVISYESRERRVFGFSPTKHVELYKGDLKNAVLNLMKNIGCKEGIACFQFITDGNKAVALEINYRLPGGKNHVEGIMCENMLYAALSEDYSQKYPVLPKFLGYSIWLKPGRIASIVGLDELKKVIPGCTITQIKNINDYVEENTGMRQIFGFIVIRADYKDGIDYIKVVNKTLKITSEQGEDMFNKYIYDPSGYAFLQE